MLTKIISVLLIFWAGFVSSISFLEAWLKFRAEGVTREIGLSIGKLVFTSLNRIEIIFLIIVWILFLFSKPFEVARFSTHWLMLVIITGVLTLQTFWLLPSLVERAELIIAGGEPPASMVHAWFALFEFAKVFLVVILSFKLN